MSDTANRVPYHDAWLLACALATTLAPACSRVEIAGSLRRRRETIGDIDLVCAPIVEPALDMFGDPTGGEVNLLHECLDDLVERGVLAKRLNKLGHVSWGPGVRRIVYKGLHVDVQIVRDQTTWGAWLAIRTGPSELNKALVTPRSKGGVLPPGFEFKDGFQLWRYGGRVETPTEDALFHALGFECPRPVDRGVTPLVPLAAAVPPAAEGVRS